MSTQKLKLGKLCARIGVCGVLSLALFFSQITTEASRGIMACCAMSASTHCKARVVKRVEPKSEPMCGLNLKADISSANTKAPRSDEDAPNNGPGFRATCADADCCATAALSNQKRQRDVNGLSSRQVWGAHHHDQSQIVIALSLNSVSNPLTSTQLRGPPLPL